jgi:UDP-N-acetylmuramyl pentapeptide phosphotransferase/UDP-N-acetylglucosamine-1-phosphate transferase
MPAMLAGAVFLSFATSAAVLAILLTRLSRIALDRPNARSLHEHPVPRTGGIALAAGCAAGIWLAPSSSALVPLGVALALGALSFVDDVRGMPAGVRFAAHLAAAAFVAWYLLYPMHPGALVLLVLAVGWITNLYNFMDGADGLAGGMAVAGFGAYAVAAQVAGEPELAAVCASLASSAFAFLLFNFHPARIFLGDVGSIPLGFLAAALGLLGWRDDAWPLWFPVLVFAPFIGDATLTLLRRLARRERVWEAHRDHYYQRMVRMGIGHRGTACISYAAMLLSALAALWGRAQAPAGQAVAFAGATVALAALAAWVDVKWLRWQRGAA